MLNLCWTAWLHVLWGVVEAIRESIISPLTIRAHLFQQLKRQQHEIMCCLLKAACGLQDGVNCSDNPRHDHTTHIRIPSIRHFKLFFQSNCFYVLVFFSVIQY